LKGNEFLPSLHCALTKHSGPSTKHIKGCYFTAGFAFQDPSATLNVPKLILDHQHQQKSSFFTFRLPATAFKREGKAETSILPAKVQFALDKDRLFDSFRLEFIIKIPFIAPPNPIQEAASLLCQLLFLEEYIQNSNSADLLQEKRKIQTLCSYADKIQLASKASISSRTITGFFPLNLDDADSRDVQIAQRLVFGALFGIDPRVKQYERFNFSLPILSDHDQLRKRPAFKSIFDEIRSNEDFADLIVIRPRRIRKYAADSDSTLDSSTSASDSDIASSTQAVKRHEAIQMLPKVPLLHNFDLESEEFPSLHQSESFKSQPLEFKLPQSADISEPISNAASKSSSNTRRVVFEDVPCKFFLRGNCRAADKCTFSHAAAKALVNQEVIANKNGARPFQRNTVENVKDKFSDAFADQEKSVINGAVVRSDVNKSALEVAAKVASAFQDKHGIIGTDSRSDKINSAPQIVPAQDTSAIGGVASHSGDTNSSIGLAARVAVQPRSSPYSALMPRNLELEWQTSNGNAPFECRILSAIARSPSFPNFYLDKDSLHSPRYLSKIKIGSFHFTQSDYGICFENFFETVHLDDDLKKSHAALEKFRCFYIHLGIGMSLHPYAIHHAFRNRASFLSQSLSKMVQAHSFLAVTYADSLRDALSSESFVDSNILLTCWPQEWSHLRIIIWQEAASTYIVYEPFPDDDNQEIILCLQGQGGGAHYTLLNHWSPSLFHSLKLFLLKNEQSHGASLMSPKKKYGFDLQVVAPESFSILNKGISSEDSAPWPELSEVFSMRESLAPFHHQFEFRTLPDVPSDLIQTPSVWPPLNSAERSAASLFPQPCKQSGRFHTCCGSAGNCQCGLSKSLDNIQGCGDSLCHWKSTEDPYHCSHDLTLVAFSEVLRKIELALPRWIQQFDQSAKDKSILAYVTTERLMSIYCTLQHRYAALEDEESIFHMRSSLLSLRLLALEAIKILEASQRTTVFPTPPLPLLRYMIETIELNARASDFDLTLDSIASTQSSDVPIISSNPKYTMERDEECSRALNFVKYIYSLATKRLHSITQEGKMVAIEQLQGLHKQVVRIADTSNNLGHGLSSLSKKRAVCTRSVEELFDSAMIIATELSSLISKIAVAEFPKAPPPPKAGSRPLRKTHAVVIIDPMLLESLCKNIEELLGKDSSSSKSLRKSQQSAQTTFSKSSNPFAPLAHLNEHDDLQSEANPPSGDEDAASSPPKESSNEDDEADEEDDIDLLKPNEAASHEEVIQLRSLAGSTASIYLAEAINVHSKGAPDSFDSAATNTANSEDRDFVNDASQESTGHNHRALFHSHALRDAGLIQPASPRTQNPITPIIYCPRGHQVVTVYRVPSDNLKRKLNKIICSVCLGQIDPLIRAYNCACVTHIVCGKCVQSTSSFSKPPSCRTCTNDLHFSHCTGKTCMLCEAPLSEERNFGFVPPEAAELPFAALAYLRLHLFLKFKLKSFHPPLHPHLHLQARHLPKLSRVSPRPCVTIQGNSPHAQEPWKSLQPRFLVPFCTFICLYKC
jgi:hypothetical protein